MADISDGVWPVTLTPFTDSRSIDWDALDRLVEWYEAAGAAGLFTVSLSSEMYDLDHDERVRLAEHVVSASDLPVVATGSFGESVEEQAAAVDEMAATGVDAVVVNVADVAPAEADEEAWLANARRLLDLTGDVPLGLYECPQPYHRLLDASTLGTLAETDRFVFHKDTCCDAGRIARRLAAVEDTPLSLFNANVPTLSVSLADGASGYSGTAANLYPDLLAWLCEHSREEPELAAELQEFLSVADYVIRVNYPRVAKQYLARGRVEMRPDCRRESSPPSAEGELTLDHLGRTVDRWRDRLDLA